MAFVIGNSSVTGATPWRAAKSSIFATVAAAADNRHFQGAAHIVIAAQALRAMQATARIPTEAHRLAEGHRFGVASRRDHFSYGFMAGHERILRQVPLVVRHGEIGMTNAAIEHFDFDLLVSQFAGIVRKRLELAAGLLYRQSVKSWHA